MAAAKSKASDTVVPKKPKTRGERWPAEKRAEVIALLMLGNYPSHIEATTGVPENTVRDWAKDLGSIDALRQGRIGDLVYKYVTESLDTLASQSTTLRDPDWVKAQPADSIAILHGVICDKVCKILAAIERGRDDRAIPD